MTKPQPIPYIFACKQNTGVNIGHENSILLRLLPLVVGCSIPEGDKTWAKLMDLKEIVQLVLSPSFTEESIQYMQSKMSDHRQSLKTVFPHFKLRPKHHYIEHYPVMFWKCLKWTFGSLLDLEI